MVADCWYVIGPGSSGQTVQGWVCETQETPAAVQESDATFLWTLLQVSTHVATAVF